MPVTSRTPVRPPPARARTHTRAPRGRTHGGGARTPRPEGAPPLGGPGAGRGGAHPDFPGSHGLRGAGGSGEGEARGARRRSSLGQGRRRPPPPLVRPLHSSSPAPAAGIRGWHQPPAQLCALFFQPPRRNLGQGRRDQTQTLALLGGPRDPPGSGSFRIAETFPHKQQPQVLFSFGAGSSLWLSLHTGTSCAAPRPSPAEVRIRAGERLFWNFEKLTRFQG